MQMRAWSLKTLATGKDERRELRSGWKDGSAPGKSLAISP
jgi:hypothetical protein